MTSGLWLGAARNGVLLGVALFTLIASLATAVAQDSGGFTCNLALGSRQVQQWFETGGVFESGVDNGRWQLKWAPDAGVDLWGDPSDQVWQVETLSTCERRAANFPDRVVFVVSGPFGNDEDAWVAAISAAVDAIFVRFASANRVELMPVVGGPDHDVCTFEGERVSASWQHLYIEAAIARVVAEDTTGILVAAPSPHVRRCSDYRDGLGHLTDHAAEAIGRELAAHYRLY